MSILLLLLHLAIQPWPARSGVNGTGMSVNLQARLDDKYLDDRNAWDIIWSCFATIFACTWLAVHPNVPSAKDGELRVFGRRLMVMGYMLLAPEIVIYWGARQHTSAKALVSRLKDMDIQWTKTQASFLIMGGFVLHDADRSFLCTLDEEELISLFKNGEIKWPSITQKAIQDRSKADVVAKCIIIFHTAWFGIQAFARWNLSITELELVTLAYAMLNGATYWLWWNKPKDVRCPVPIYLKSLATSTSQRVQAARARRDGANPNVQSPTATDSEPMGNLNISQQAPVPGLAPPPSGGIIKRVEHFLESFGTSFRHRRQSMGPTLAIFLTFIWDPMKRLYTPIWHMLDTDTLDEDDLSRVPTFYSSKQIPHAKGLIRSTPVQVMTMLIIAFGSIHTFVWEQETQVWRMACVIIIMTPCFIPFVYLFLDIWKDGRPYNLLYYLLWTTFSVSLVMYIFARGVLIILPLVRLSDPPPDALKEYKWTEFLPHVGT